MKRFFPILLSVVFILAFAVGCKKDKADPNLPPILSDVEMLSMDGVEMLKQQYKGKILVINFFASWCPPCKIETPDFVNTYEAYKDTDFMIIGLSIDDSKSDLINFVNKYRMTFPVYLADKPLQNRYNISKVPTTLIYDKNGSLAHIAEGILNEAYLKRLGESARQQ